VGRGRLRGDSWGVYGVARGGGGGFWSTPVVLGWWVILFVYYK
jgi:hypothetical protein